MSNFLINCLKFQRINLFHLTCNHHAHNSNNMKFCRMNWLNFLLEVPIHELYSCKVGLVWELVRSHHLYHPIKHSSSEVGVNLVIVQKLRGDLIIYQTVQKLRTVNFAVELSVVLGHFLYLELRYFMLHWWVMLLKVLLDVFSIEGFVNFTLLITIFVVIFLLIESFTMSG